MRTLFALFALLAGLAPGQASAMAQFLAPIACTTGAASVEAALAVPPARLDCGADRFSLRDRFVRAHVALDRIAGLPDASLMWESEPILFGSMLIRLSYADGSRRIIDVDRQMTARNWSANGNFWVELKPGPARLVALDLVVERPHSGALLANMTLWTMEDATAANYRGTLAVFLVCGVLLVPIIYNLLFYRVLRERFILWHAGITAGTLLYVIFRSGVIMLFWPSLSSVVRFAAIYAAGSLVLICVIRFGIRMLEEGAINPRLAKMVNVLAAIPLVLSVFIALDIEPLRMRIVPAFFLSLQVAILAAFGLLIDSIFRRRRGTIVLLVAFTPAIVAAFGQSLQGLGLVGRPDVFNDLLYAALMLTVVGTSAFVGHRFVVIKGERDRARITAQRLGTMATTDWLTGLLNRRAFDRHRRLASGRLLLVADLDRFKAINDTFGHQRGDAVLCHAAQAIAAVVASAPGGSVYRLGGEEFGVLATLSDRAKAEALCESIRLAVAARSQEAELLDLPPVTISIGGVLGRGQAMHIAYAEADRALYRSKQAGRDRWEVVVS